MAWERFGNGAPPSLHERLANTGGRIAQGGFPCREHPLSTLARQQRAANSGSINVQQGTLAATLSGAHTGSFTTAAGAWLEFAAGTDVTHEFNAGSSISGNVRFIDGRNSNVGASNFNTGSTYDALATEVVARGLVSFNNTANGANTSTLAVSGGILRGNGNLAVSGFTSFTGGQIGGGGGNVIANVGLVISGSDTKNLSYVNAPASSGIINNAPGVWSGSGNLNLSGNGLLRNGVSGTFDIQTDADFLSVSTVNGGTFDNQGRLIKSVGSADGSDRTVISATLLNSGSLVVQQGVMQVTTAFNNQGALTVAAGARFESANNAFSNSSAATLRGNGTVQTAPNQALINQGALSPGESIGRLTIDGGLIEAATASLNIEIFSLASFDQLAVTKAATLAGKLAIWNLGYEPTIGDRFIVMTFDQRLDASNFLAPNLYGFAVGTAFEVSYHEHDVTLTVTAIPEPQIWLLMAAGMGVLGTLVSCRRMR